MENEYKNLHENRMSVDPMYRLFMEPYSFVDKDAVFIDTLLSLCVEFIYKRYGDKLKSVHRIYTLLINDEDPVLQSDYKIKTFALIFILQWEPELRQEIIKMYNDQSSYVLLKGSYHFAAFMCRMDDNIDMTLNFPYSKYNICGIVHNFVQAAIREYFMGPTKR